MTAAMAENDRMPHRRPWDDLLRAWRELDVPEGWRAEIDGGQIVVVPPPHAHHNGIAAKVQRLLYRTLPEELEIYQTLGIHIAPLDKLYVPDLVVMPTALIDAADPDTSDPVDAAEALLVVEITSKSNAKDDRTKKLWSYAHAPVPTYLLIDRFDEHGPTATLFTTPLNGAYKHSERVPFGEQIKLPEPFGCLLDTAAFPG
ncbi:Uma2 family endonuclease [Streptomyces sp. NBC_01387]|uniref:Uma2 family endonuclease n=1 Tax=unclassified Streptomyces TaxID=2593676 RepID=UPI002023FC3B|nr:MULTISPECIES: Uma2 family endonuclease [unclassified Streptomyces]MCX4550094.1 Uma2 family endonuclease [Streptomyces sp. NBC_01500]WSC21590.1 Uma2 family endonuclease [Streptomyces sp. NBC_01766]WSV55553.1 Uma2 family endonuclease [Streptomyces sp. NBC_01014]